MINIVVPMAGAGSRFAKAGYDNPKPFIDVLGKMMIIHVIENIGISGAKYIFICQKGHLKKFGPDFIFAIKESTFIKDFEIIEIDGITEGAAVTALKTKEFTNNSNELLIVNSDQLVGAEDIKNSTMFFEKNAFDGGVICFFNNSIKWSYCKVGNDRLITRIAEKQQISEHATVGIYWWKYGSDFVDSAERMIEKNDRVNGEFYIAPTYNYMIMDDKKVAPYFVNEMQGLGTPEDLNKYIKGETYK